MSEHKSPVPVAKTFLLCREIFQDHHTKEHILIGPVVELVAPQFPFLASVNVFGQLTSLRGSYRLKLQLQDEEGATVWFQEIKPPIENSNPLLTVMVAFNRMPVLIPRVGKYDMVLLANDVETARYGFAAAFPKPPKPDVAAGPAGQ